MAAHIIDAITHAKTAGKLRAYVRENAKGQELRGLLRLADAHSKAAARSITPKSGEEQ